MAASDRFLPAARNTIAIASGKLLARTSRRFGRGGGTALPGVIAERVAPRLVDDLARQLGAGRLLVTGTNGKTTTARLLAAAGDAAGVNPVYNRSGSNLMRGLAATLVEAAGIDGRIRDAERRAGIFEIDEATLPYAVGAVRPSAIVFTNLFRDQLDRYGEVDSILGLWRRSLRFLPEGAVIALNADDPSVAELAGDHAGRALFYGIDDVSAGGSGAGSAEHAADARWCRACGAEFAYSPIYFAHIGLWRCPNCGRKRREPDIRVTRVVGTEEDGLQLTIAEGDAATELRVPLTGLYNAYNAVAAYAGARLLGIEAPAIRKGFASFSAVFGRQERIVVDGREVHVLLCKNPAGTNQALSTVLTLPEPVHLLVALNDGVQDGRDISWIWDVDFEDLRGRVAGIVATGSRAADLALRLKYAGLARELTVEPEQGRAFERALAATPPRGRLYVLPTYTAMLTLRELIALRGGRGHFWSD